ncbi:cytochrome c biogenesis protein CcdA [Frankia sp. AgB32]|uniref:cytochrome c biogenesis protein CcdA n=1 Tax=Frankia sp. AgB32 TaxID=631119 RepID=UPI00200F97E3|nr:cytochrome c biogenesis protein CcdA [Frankia sp. AgB32]MCK9894497.1 redoxin domain-containing protein [Frankia sp. AgB32]
MRELLIGLVGGLITGISPCVLPVLPVVFMSGGAAGPRGADSQARAGGRPFLVVLGLAISFSLITLLGTVVVDALPIPQDTLRWAGLVVLVLLGIGMLVPRVQELLERPFARLRGFRVDGRHRGFVLGLALGAVYVPCAGPVLAAITVAGATGHIGVHTVELTVAFAVGASVPLMIFALAGQRVAERVQSFRRRQRGVQIVAGVVLIGLAVALSFNVTDALQRAVPDYTAALNRDLDHAGQTDLAAQSNSPGSCSQEPALTLSDCGKAPGITGIQQWLNTPGGKPAATAGKVTIVDFWAYSCINCQRAIPHVEGWYRNYAGAGLQVIGVHTPEYAFEHVPSNVAAGARRLHITYPVAIDNGYATWNAFTNESWPAEYLIDANGQIRHIAIGEGSYGETESLIRQLLTAAHPGVSLPRATDVADTTPTDVNQSPETYLGTERQQAYAGDGPLRATASTYEYPSTLPSNTFALTGSWTASPEALTAGEGAGIELNFDADNVYLDLAGTGTITTTLDGHTTSQHVGGAPNIYTLVSEPKSVTGTLDVRLSPGLQAYSFTFG